MPLVFVCCCPHPIIHAIHILLIGLFLNSLIQITIAVVYDEISGAVLHDEAPRGIGHIIINLDALDGVQAANLHAYLAFTRRPVPGTSEKGQVSGTAYKKIP